MGHGGVVRARLRNRNLHIAQLEGLDACVEFQPPRSVRPAIRMPQPRLHPHAQQRLHRRPAERVEFRFHRLHVSPRHQHQPRSASGRFYHAVLPGDLQRDGFHAGRLGGSDRRFRQRQLCRAVVLRDPAYGTADQHRMGKQLAVRAGGADGSAGGFPLRDEPAATECTRKYHAGALSIGVLPSRSGSAVHHQPRFIAREQHHGQFITPV